MRRRSTPSFNREAESMTHEDVVKHPAAALGRMGLALTLWMVGSGLFMTPAAGQACVGTVDAPAGAICGLAIEAPPTTNRDLYNYRGIPYAQPPVGDLRWASPQPYPRWSDLRAATSFGAICPQDGATD